MAKTVNELREIEIERLDAVDDPASRRRWLILKSTGDSTMDPKAMEQAALALCASLKEDAEKSGLAMSEGSLAALNALAKSLGLADQYAAKPADEPKKPEEPELPEAAAPVAETAKVAEPAADPKPAEPAPTADATAKAIEQLTKSVTDLAVIVTKIEAAQKPAADPKPAPSAQPKGQESIQKNATKFGDGLFANVIFGR